MSQYSIPRQIKRSRMRLFFGRYFYIFKRYFEWKTSGINFAKTRKTEKLPFKIFEHSSTLMRQLKDVEMYLQYNKIDNLRLAIEKINGIIIEPGEVFSFWYLVKNPTKKRGFKLGMVLHNGQVKTGYGGGLCQLSNLIYWMTLHSPLSVKERWRHSYDVFPDVNRTLPFGSGATLSYNYIDLQIENNTSDIYQFLFWLTEHKLHGEIRSNRECLNQYKIIEKNHLISGPFAGRYIRHNEIFREVYSQQDSQFIREDFVTENNALMMYEPLLPEAKDVE